MKIGIVGCAGKMGKMLVQKVLATPSCVLVGGAEEPRSAAVGQDLGEVAGVRPLGLTILKEAEGLFEQAQAVIDFTTPGALLDHAPLAARHHTALIVGTTGLEQTHRQALSEAAQQVPVVYAANMSLGVSVLISVIEQVTRALGSQFDIEILEMHHRHKRDAPSGTALAFGQTAAQARGVALEDVQCVHSGVRPENGIGFASLRGGDVVGEHTIMFCGPGEQIALTHKSSGRHVFAIGAITAALWTEKKPPGLYSMRDVLAGGLRGRASSPLSLMRRGGAAAPLEPPALIMLSPDQIHRFFEKNAISLRKEPPTRCPCGGSKGGGRPHPLSLMRRGAGRRPPLNPPH